LESAIVKAKEAVRKMTATEQRGSPSTTTANKSSPVSKNSYNKVEIAPVKSKKTALNREDSETLVYLLATLHLDGVRLSTPEEC
jgi:ribosomal protein RSM22 (predicted rRNA methylase)